MNAAEALRSIRFDWVRYIQERVRVDFDNRLQAPVQFLHGEDRRFIRKLLGRFRVREGGFLNGFLVKADDEEVYFLYFHRFEDNAAFNKGCWVLSFRILSDKELMAFYRDERKMLVDMTVKKVVDFHGHLCPELVIGMKACEYAQKLFHESEMPASRISVMAENSTSALDALQVLFGVTLGNQGLKVFDFGKHNYTFLPGDAGNGFTLKLKPQCYGNEEEYEKLEERIVSNQITLDEVAQFQHLLDSRVLRLLSSDPEDLFVKGAPCCSHPSMEVPTVYVNCLSCGEQVIRERAVHIQGKAYCIPCLELLKVPGADRSLH